MSKLLCILILVTLVSCKEQVYSGNKLFKGQVLFLEYMCDKRSSCLNQLNRQAMICDKKSLSDSDIDAMTNQQGFKVVYEFHACIRGQMDDAFAARSEQVFPGEEVNVQVNSSNNNVSNHWNKVSYGFQDDPTALQIEQQDGQFKILNQLFDVNEIKQFIRDEGLTDSYESAVIIVSDDLNAGVMVSLISALKLAGFNKTSIASKERLATMESK